MATCFDIAAELARVRDQERRVKALARQAVLAKTIADADPLVSASQKKQYAEILETIRKDLEELRQAREMLEPPKGHHYSPGGDA